MLSACFGVGAVTGALLMPRVLHRTSLITLVIRLSHLWVGAATLIALTTTRRSRWSARAVVAPRGWVLASLSAGTQSAAGVGAHARCR
jgi:hypothetical protein